MRAFDPAHTVSTGSDGWPRSGLAALCRAARNRGSRPQRKDVHQLYVIIMALALPVFIGGRGAADLVHRPVPQARRRRPPQQSVGGNRSLVVFFAIPAVIVAILFPFGERTLMALEKTTTPQVHIKVEGFQWEWTFLYLSEGIFVSGKTASEEAPQVPAVMELPVGEPVEIELTSRDVIHSFFVPDLLFKRDAIPGRTSTFQFTPTTIGTFHSQCAEFCGLYHSKMTFEVQRRLGGRLPGVDPAATQGGEERHLRPERHRPVARRAQHLLEPVLPRRAREHAVHREHRQPGRGHRAQLLDLRLVLREHELLQGPQDHRGVAAKPSMCRASRPGTTTSNATSTAPRCRVRSSSRPSRERGGSAMAVTECPDRPARTRARSEGGSRGSPRPTTSRSGSCT